MKLFYLLNILPIFLASSRGLVVKAEDSWLILGWNESLSANQDQIPTKKKKHLANLFIIQLLGNA
jgi:hypothetical protein